MFRPGGACERACERACEQAHERRVRFRLGFRGVSGETAPRDVPYTARLQAPTCPPATPRRCPPPGFPGRAPGRDEPAYPPGPEAPRGHPALRGTGPSGQGRARRRRTGRTLGLSVARGGKSHVGPGRDGTLSAAAAQQAASELGLTPAQVCAGWDRARLAGLIELHGDRARPGWRLRAWDRDDAAVLRGWVALFDAWSIVHPAPEGITGTSVAEVVEALPQVLSLLQLSAGPVQVPALLDLLEQRVVELREERCEVPYDSQPLPAPAAPDAPLSLLLDWALEGQAAVGALTLGPGIATLTALGNWAVWVKLEQICVAAQSPAGNIEQSAEDMLRGCARLTPGPARASTAPGSPPAPSPAPSPSSSKPPAARTRCCADSPSTRCGWSAPRRSPAYGPRPTTVRCAPTPCCGWRSTRAPTPRTSTRSSPARSPPGSGWTPPRPSPTTATSSCWCAISTPPCSRPCRPARRGPRRRHPRTVQVLVALAAAHPDPALAKAMRRAAFQVHTGGV